MKNIKSVLYLFVFSILITGLIGCGPKQTAQAPSNLIKDYIAKHKTMVDATLSGLYVKDEQVNITKLVNNTIAAQKGTGTLLGLQQATFDFSSLQIKVLDEKEDYVQDEPAQFLKIAVKGNYTMNTHGSIQSIATDQTIILEKERGTWKVTETRNPWS